jgi:hypothetical protein
MRTAILFAMLCPFLQGCVGVVVPRPRTETIDNPRISFYVHEPYGVTRRTSSEATNAVVYTSEWLQTSWGTPNSIRRLAGTPDEVWTYRSGPIWEGVVPFVIIPVPLVLPITKKKVRFSLRDGHVVSATVTDSFAVGGTFGFIPNPEGGGTFGAWNWADSFR